MISIMLGLAFVIILLHAKVMMNVDNYIIIVVLSQQ